MSGYMHTGLKSMLQKHASDICILSAVRTPTCKSFKGSLKAAYDHELLAAVLSATLARNPTLDPSIIEATIVGNVLSELGGSKAGRMASLHAGIPNTAAFSTVNRACASSLTAITSLAHAMAAGEVACGVAAGMESMTRNYGSKAVPTQLWPALRASASKDARECIMPMGLTAENVAQRYGVARTDMDAFAARSQQKAAAAQEAGWFDEEIVPVSLTTDGSSDGNEVPTKVVSRDDGIRAGTTAEKLSSMKPAFAADGTCTAGNSSQISDGAAALLLMRRSTATALGLGDSIIGKWAGSRIAGCAPDEMGIGPALAVPKLLDAVDVRTEDVNVWELNEAFAAQALYCMRVLGLDEERVNPRGGAIALGHALGATGARLATTLLAELRRRGERVGVATLCIGTGMGQAVMFIAE